jgi:DNA-directed RNA polymerase alpha subunit
MDQIKEDHDNKDGSKRQKITHECKLCYVEQCSTILKCGHEMCAECCIKHFRKTVNCPFCRAVICEKEDRTDEYKQIIKDDLQDRYEYLDYDPIKEMTMYEFLKFKGVNKKDAREIIDSMRDRCLEMFKSSEEYTEILSTIQEEWEELWDSDSDSDSEDEAEFKSQYEEK